MSARPSAPTAPLKCSVCRERITGVYYTNIWRRPFHRAHQACDCCVRPMREGRHRLCARCRPTIVTSAGTARVVINKVRFALNEERGVAVSDGLHARLVPFVGGNCDRLGQAVLERIVDTDGRSSASATLHLKRGLPAIQFASVVAHELAHAWLWENEVRPSRQVDEGIAELCAFWTLGRMGGATAAALQARIAGNRDPVYGAGYREAREAENRFGWPHVRTHLLREGYLP